MKRRASTAALVVAAALAVVPAAPALAAPSDVVEVTMGVTGGEGVRDLGVPLFGDVVVVPGDRGTATLRVRNDGPSDGVLTATIRDTQLHNPDHEDDVYDHLRINGIPASQLAQDHTVVHRVAVERGATVDLPFSYEFPVALEGITSGNAAHHGPREVSFIVHLHKTGQLPGADDPADPAAPAAPGPAVQGPAAPGPASPGPASPGVAAPETPGSAGDWDGVVAKTGGTALGPELWLLVAAAVAVALAADRARRRAHAEGS